MAKTKQKTIKKKKMIGNQIKARQEAENYDAVVKCPPVVIIENHNNEEERSKKNLVNKKKKY